MRFVSIFYIKLSTKLNKPIRKKRRFPLKTHLIIEEKPIYDSDSKRVLKRTNNEITDWKI